MNDLGFWHVVIVAGGIGLMLLLSMKFKLNGLISLLVAAIAVGLLEGMSLPDLLKTVETGFGGTLGHLALVVIFGAVIGRLLVDSGAAHQIANTVLRKFGIKYVQLAVILIGAILGIAVFYEVAFIVLAPLVITIAVEAKVPFLKLAIPAVAAATTTHSLFPPQAGPVALVAAYGADMGMVYFFAVIVAIPTILVTGLLLPRFLGNLERPVPALVKQFKPVPDDEMPSFGISLLVPLLPAIIITGVTVVNVWLPEGNLTSEIVNFVGAAPVAMFIAMMVGFWLLGIRRGQSMTSVMDTFEKALKAIAMVVMIIGAGGAFKQVILDSGVGDYIAQSMTGSSVSPLILAWGITVAIRLATGQGVVSAITAAGIVGPLIGEFGVNPALMVMATAVGSNTITHVNDASFWLFKGYFDLSIKDTFKTWGLLQLTNSLVGLGVVMLLSLFF